MPVVSTDVRIQAERAAVWRALSDFPRYAEWNPLLRRVDGELRPGAKIRLVIKLPVVPQFPVSTTIQGVEFGVSFGWEGYLISPRIFRGDHQFRVISDGNGTTRFQQAEHYSGLLACLARLAMPLIAHGFKQMNDSLKAYAEQS